MTLTHFVPNDKETWEFLSKASDPVLRSNEQSEKKIDLGFNAYENARVVRLPTFGCVALKDMCTKYIIQEANKGRQNNFKSKSSDTPVCIEVVTERW